MRVYVPYVRLSEQTRQALEPFSPTYIETSGEFGYIDALESIWSRGEGFVLVEQDKVPTAEQIRELIFCREPWCYCRCKTNAGTYASFPSLSTVRFSETIVRLHPDFMHKVRLQAIGDTPAGHYSRLDMAVYTHAMLGCYLQPHPHGEVLHVHQGGGSAI